MPGHNVNMVGGPVKFRIAPPLPIAVDEGDPFLQRQNEPSCTAMNRNPLRVFCGANDYRTVDLPGLPEHKMTRDAWLGYYWSTDGGDTWRNRLLPGFPQDGSPDGLASPLHGLEAGADATVRAGVGDLIYYSGIAFNRDATNSSSSGAEGKKGVLFMARFSHPNLANDPEPFRYLDTRVVDDGSSGRFLDKPWFAVDQARNASTCTIQVPGATPQTIPAGNLYVGYSVFVGNSVNRTKILISRSTDCGATWGHATKLSEGYPINQGISIAIDPRTGWVYAAWRRIAAQNEPDGILYAVSRDGGATYSKAAEIAVLPPLTLPTGATVSRFFDQGATPISMRTVAFPHIGIGDSGVNGVPGPVYVTWSQRWPQQQTGVEVRDARVVLTVGTPSLTTTTWSAPTPVHNPPDVRGHQVQPTAAVVAGTLNIAYLYLQEDHTAGVFTPVEDDGPDGVPGTADDALLYSESREAAGDLAPPPGEPDKVFTDFVADRALDAEGQFTVPLKRRHTIDTWLSQANLTPAGQLPLGPSPFQTVRVSQYAFGKKNDRLEQLQYSPPNYKLFAQGTLAFIGDYIDIGRPLFRLGPGGTAQHHTSHEQGGSPVLYVTWTDNRDVRPPVSGDWTQYTPVVYPELGGQSVFDPSQPQPACNPAQTYRTGMRNQNVYASRVTRGLFVSSLTNQKPLSHATFTDDGVTFTVDEHVFPVTIENETDQTRTFRVELPDPTAPDPTAPDPTATTIASFDQFSVVTKLELQILRRSSTARNVFVRSSDRKASVKVTVKEIDGLGGSETVGGLQHFTILNPDPTAPDPTAPDPTAPDPTATELYTVDLGAPDPTAAGVDVTNSQVLSPDPTAPDPTAVTLEFPDPTAPDPTAPDPTAPDPTAPDPTAADVANPDVTAPDPTAPDPTANALTDTVFEATNTGDNAAAYKVKLVLNTPPPPGFRVQLILNRFYSTPGADGCQAATIENPVVLANIPDTAFTTTTTDLASPDPTATGVADASFTLGAQQSGFITVRIFDPDRSDNITFTDPTTGRTFTRDPDFNPVEDVDVVVIPPVDNVDAAQGVTEPQVATSFLYVTTGALPVGIAGSPYSARLRASGSVGAVTWTIASGSLAPGLALDAATGLISGTPLTAGTYPFTAQIQDSATPTPQVATRALSVTVVPLGVASLAFVQQPTNTDVSTPISPPVTVRAVSATGTAVPGVAVQIAIGRNPGEATLKGTTTVTTGPDGVAIFRDLVLNARAAGYTLVATAAGYAAATSLRFDIEPLVGVATDPAGDAGAGNPDLTSATVSVARGNITLSVRFAPGTFDQATSHAQFSLDTDENAATGHLGTDAGCVSDNGRIGSEFIVNLGSTFYGTQAEVRRFVGPSCNDFGGGTALGTVTYLTDGMDVTLPLSAIGGDDGQLRFKVTSSTFLDPGFTGVLDRMTDAGLPATKVPAPLASGVIADPAGDVVATDPDVVSAELDVRGGNLEVSIRFAAGTFDPATGVASLFLDTDGSAVTGHAGLDSGCTEDASLIGSEFIVSMGSDFYGADATVYRYVGPSCNQFVVGATATGVVYVTDGMDAKIPLEAIGSDDGRLRFKVTTIRHLPDACPACFTGLLDRAPDTGVAPGQVGP